MNKLKTLPQSPGRAVSTNGGVQKKCKKAYKTIFTSERARQSVLGRGKDERNSGRKGREKARPKRQNNILLQFTHQKTNGFLMVVTKLRGGRPNQKKTTKRRRDLCSGAHLEIQQYGSLLKLFPHAYILATAEKRINGRRGD